MRYTTLARRCSTALVAFALAACGSGDSIGPVLNGGGGGHADVRFVNAVPSGVTLDVTTNGQLAVGDLGFEEITGYLAQSADTVNLIVEPTNQTGAVLDTTISLPDSAAHTVILTGLVTEVRALVLDDSSTAPASGQAKVRVVHAAPSIAGAGGQGFDIFITTINEPLDTSTPVTTNAILRTVTPYVQIPAGDGQVRLVRNGTIVFDSGAIPFQGGSAYTVVVVDDPAGGTSLDFLVLTDRT